MEFSIEGVGVFVLISVLVFEYDVVFFVVLLWYVEVLLDIFRNVLGIKLVEIFGELDEEVFVMIDLVIFVFLLLMVD